MEYDEFEKAWHDARVNLSSLDPNWAEASNTWTAYVASVTPGHIRDVPPERREEFLGLFALLFG